MIDSQQLAHTISMTECCNALCLAFWSYLTCYQCVLPCPLNSTQLAFIRLACAGLALSRIGVPVCACSVDPCEVVRRVACDAYLLVFSRV